MMDTFIKRTADEQHLYFEQAQARLGLPSTSIEKDFWVCWTLWKLFNLPEYGKNLVFKGGTSLSKGWDLIKRFSEDIDVVVNRDSLGFGGDKSPDKAPSEKQRKIRLKDLKKACHEHIHSKLRPTLERCFADTLPANLKWSLDIASPDEDPDGQTLLFQYPGNLTGSSSYLRSQVKIELGARSDVWPTERPLIQPYLAGAFPLIFEIDNFTVQAVAPERTFWEKAMLLHEETCRPAGKPRKARLARHYYDLWCLIQKGVAARAIQNSELFTSVAEHRAIFFNQNWVDYDTIQRGSLRFLPADDKITAWKQDYQAMQNEMFFGAVPDFYEIMRVVGDFQDIFNRG